MGRNDTDSKIPSQLHLLVRRSVINMQVSTAHQRLALSVVICLILAIPPLVENPCPIKHEEHYKCNFHSGTEAQGIPGTVQLGPWLCTKCTRFEMPTATKRYAAYQPAGVGGRRRNGQFDARKGGTGRDPLLKRISS